MGTFLSEPRRQIAPCEVPTVVPRCSEKGADYGAVLVASRRIDLHHFAPKARECGSPEVATRGELARRRPLEANGLEERRARDGRTLAASQLNSATPKCD